MLNNLAPLTENTQDKITDIADLRAKVIEEDKRALMIYGSHLTFYCRRLYEIAMTFTTVSEHMGVITVQPVSYASLQGDETYNVLKVYKNNRLVCVLDHLASVMPFEDHWMSQEFSERELNDMLDTLLSTEEHEMTRLAHILKMPTILSYNIVKTLRMGAQADMETDKHDEFPHNTVYMMATASMPYANLDHVYYMIDPNEK